MTNKDTCLYFRRMRSTCTNDQPCGNKRKDEDGHKSCAVDGILECDRIKAKEIKK
jgi:hypothetical protein